jgi:ribonucleoside-diphosphate reductase beta chain
VPLDQSRAAYRPFEYPWCYDAWKAQQDVHWMPAEIPMGDDVRDWDHRLTPGQRNLLTQIFRFFTQSDVEVADNYMERYARIFKPTEVKMMLAAFTNMETIHIAAYELLVSTVGMPDEEYGAFLKYKSMRDKHDYMQNFNVDDPYQVALTLAAFGAFTEGLQLFGSFAMLMNFPRHNLMKGMGQIVTYSVRDETMHCDNIIRLYHTWLNEHPEINRDELSVALATICRTMRDHEHAFIDLAFELGDVDGMTAQEVKDYIDFVANWRMKQLGEEGLWPERTENPLPWLGSLLTGHEHVNFFEARATEYTKNATEGTWDDVYSTP